MNPKILIVDDEKPTRDVLVRFLSRKYECLAAADAEAAFQILSEDPSVALMVSDVRMPGEDGLSLFRRAREKHPALVCILVTAFGDVASAVDAMREGVFDFIMKPVDLGQLELRIARALNTVALEREVSDLKSRLSGEIESFTGRSPAMEKVYSLIRKVAPASANVLVQGPSGSGKELVARALHNLSPRAKGPFVPVECASLPASVLETELFGAVKGGYTGAVDRAGCFETANGGTLFLDEIGEIDANVQVKLLRVLETRTFSRVGETALRKSDFRLVTATNKNLAALVADGRFREDLYYRLNVIDIHLPALRERPGDIALLVSRFLKEFSRENGGTVTGIDAHAMKALEDYPWPGNVRELRNVVEKMVVLSGGGKLTLDDVPVEITAARPVLAPVQTVVNPAPPTPPPVAVHRPLTVPAAVSLQDAEKAQILATLAACGNNKSKAAIQLGISRRTLHRKLNEWGMK